jgi:acyl carrier protein
MAPDKNQLEGDMLQFVRSRCPDQPDLAVGSDLLEDSILDSLLLIDLIFEIEDRYGIKLESDQISPSHFRTISDIAALVTAQLNRQTA